MYNVLIVDDEPLILAGIISMINWEEYNCRIVCKASNGKQALEKIKELSIDIVITDIKMPVMNGIEMIQEMIGLGLDSTYILLTNLEDFALVKKAMNLGVVDYLVKLELTEDILGKSINKAIEICNKNRIFKSYDKQNKDLTVSIDDNTLSFFEKLINNPSYLEAINIPDYILKTYKEPLIISICLYYDYERIPDKLDKTEQKRIMSYVENILNEMVKRFFKNNCLIKMNNNTFMLIISTYKIENYIDSIKSMGGKITTILKDYFEVSVFMAVSKKGNSIADIELLKNQIDRIIDHSYHNKVKEIIFYQESYTTYNYKKIGLSAFKKSIALALRQNNSALFKENINKFIEMLEEHRLSKVQVVELCQKLLHYIISAYEDEIDIDLSYLESVDEKIIFLSTFEDLIKYILSISEEVIKFINKKKINKSDKIIELVKKYIEDNYKEKISLNRVSEDLNISSGYLSSIFKKHTGVNFSDYVSEIKVEKAKEIIRTRYYMIYEISDMLGFDNPYYFSKVFKKVTGYTPKEYEILSLKSN